MVDDTGRLSGTELAAVVGDLADALGAAGVRPGDVVGWQLPNSAVALALYRACWRLGAVAAPVHHRLGPAEVSGALDQVAPILVVTAAGLAAAEPGVTVAGPAEAPAPVIVAPTAGAGRPPSPAAVIEALARRSARRPRGPGPVGTALTAGREGGGPRGSDVAVVLFTSGSTGRPKAVLHTHRGLGYKAALMASAHGLRPGEAVLMPAPLAHVSGLLNGVLLPAVLGGRSVLMATWDPERALAHIADEHVAFMGAPPVFFQQMAAAGSFRPEGVASLRLVSTGGASVSPAFVDATTERFGCRVKRTYGSTEAPTVTTSGPDDPAAAARESDGRPVGEAELRLAEPGTVHEVPPGTEGEILVRGPELFAGYVDPVATAAVRRRGGWFATGDLGVVDDGGWLTVVGRLSDIIIRAGENISASEVEAVLEAHPSVRAAVAVPVPDEAVGERVAAYVVADGPFDLDACRHWFTERGIARYKTPEHVVRVDELPVLAAGKPDRATLRDRAASTLASTTLAATTRAPSAPAGTSHA